MKRLKLPLSEWSWDGIVLILGPVLVSVVLVALFTAGLLPFDWPGLLVLVALVNVAGDFVYALKNERSVKLGRVPLRNDVVGRQATVEASFAGRSPCHGTVILAGERWRAVCNSRVDAGARVRIVGRRGLVLDVEPDTGAVPGD